MIGFLLQQLGALLVSGLIVIPAAASRMVATSFRQMLLLSAAFGLLAGALGIVASAQLNLPTGPTIVLANVAFLILAMALGAILGRGKLIRPERVSWIGSEHAVMSWFTFTWQNFLYSFLALAFEGLPFVLVGSLISGAIAAFVPSKIITAIPAKKWLFGNFGQRPARIMLSGL